MNYKQILGLISIILGIILLVCGFYIEERMQEAREEIDKATKKSSGLLPQNPVEGMIKKMVKGKLLKKVDKYKRPARLCFVGGFILIFVGGVIIFLGRNRK